MYYEDESHTAYFIAGMAVGLLIGAGIAMLSAPQSGRRTRRKIKRRVSGAGHTVGDAWEDWGDELKDALEAGRRRLNL